MDTPPETEREARSAVRGFWDDVIGDMEATAAEYRDAGWETLELHPGDVTPVPGLRGGDRTRVGDDGRAAGSDAAADEYGLDVLAPDDEFAALTDRVEGATFDAYDAYRAQRGGVVFLVLAMRAPAAERAVLLPLHYRLDEGREMCRRADAAGEMRVSVRPLSDDRRVTFTQADPSNLLPADADG